MAVKELERKYISTLESFIGLSTDEKPTTDAQGILLRPGCTFWELDTKIASMFDGISTWYAV